MGKVAKTNTDCPDCTRIYYNPSAHALQFEGSDTSCESCGSWKSSVDRCSKRSRKPLIRKKRPFNPPITLLSVTKLRNDFEGGGGGSEYPYLREMKERLLIAKDTPLGAMDDPSQIDAENQLLERHHTPVGTVVKLNADGYGSHTSPTHRVESFYTGTLESRKTNVHEFYPKNAKTSSFITLSMLYATLLVVVCLGFVLSEVLTHNVPLYYYEAFFTYLYGFSILFLLYVFCYLLSGSSREPGPPKNQVFMVRLSMLSLVTRTLTRSSSFLTRFCRPF